MIETLVLTAIPDVSDWKRLLKKINLKITHYLLFHEIADQKDY